MASIMSEILSEVGQQGSPVDSAFDCHPGGQGSNPCGGNICAAVFGVSCLFVISKLLTRIEGFLFATHPVGRETCECKKVKTTR